MDTTKRHDPANNIGMKLCIIILIGLVLLVPRIFIQKLVDERNSTQNSAYLEICEKWSGEQIISGPMIQVNRGKNSPLYIMPETLNVEGHATTQTLKRGIFDFAVYQIPIHLSGAFILPKELSQTDKESIAGRTAQLILGISELKGLTDNPTIIFDQEKLDASPSNNEIGSNALIANITLQPLLDGKTIEFNIDLPIKGSERLQFLPVGRTTSAHISSNCETPSFNGNHLPTERTIDEKGFDAKWKILAINRQFGQVVEGKASIEEICNVFDATINNCKTSHFGVDIRVPVEQYQQTTRAIKYSFLIILLTFCVVFFVEIRKKNPIHPVQYLLIGIAIMLFYTLLLSFSEHLSFLISYIIASIMTISLITIYMAGILHIKKTALSIGALLLAIYTFIYVLLQLESYALLVGSIGIFVILALSMHASRKIEWYNTNENEL